LFVPPYERGFYCNDETIRFPYLPDTIPLWFAGFYGATACTVIIMLTEVYVWRPCCANKEDHVRKSSKFVLYMLHGLVLYALGAISTLLITEVGKRTIGRLRPHFMEVCNPDFSKFDCFVTIDGVQIPNYIRIEQAGCRGNPRLIREARVSFPSGHSSFTTYSMLFLIIYLEGRIRLDKTRFFKAFIQLAAFIAAWHTCLSRVSDFKHHHTDVIGGAFLGACVAFFVTIVIGKKLWEDHHNQPGPSTTPNGDADEQQQQHQEEAYDL